MVMFKRLKERLYVEAVYDSDVARARVGFVSDRLLTEDELDPVARIGEGCLILFPLLDDAKLFVAGAVSLLDERNPNKRARIAYFNRRGDLRAGELVLSAGVGQPIDLTAIRFGLLLDNSGSAPLPPTGNGRWRLNLSSATLATEQDALVVRFATGADRPGLKLDAASVPFPSGERRLELRVSGSDRGLWRFAGTLDASLVQELGVGPRYFSAKQQGAVINISHFAYPLLDLAAQQRERFEFELDCADPYDATADEVRSRLIMPGTELPTHLHSVHGHRLFLKPAGGGSNLLGFTKAPLSLASPGGKLMLRTLEHHLVPFGSFELHADDSSATAIRLGLGASNLESLELKPGTGGDLLKFALRPALIADMALREIKSLAASAADPLQLSDPGGFFRTSWLSLGSRLTRSGTSRLSIDPEGMQAYAPGGDAMRFSPTRPPIELEAVPWVPVLGVGSRPNNGVAELAIDREILSRARRRLFLTARSSAFLPSLRPAIVEPSLRTPQGYAAARTAEGWLTNVVFGRTNPRDEERRKAAELPDFGLVPKDDGDGHTILAEMMASNRLCVVTRLSTLVKYFKPESLGRIYMADWKAGWIRENGTNARDPYFILKHDNRSLKELIQNSTQWTNESGPLALSPEDRKDVLGVVRKVWESTDPLYAPLRRRIERSDWSGLLLLTLDLSEMPPQLGALESLVDEPLVVHHVGIDLSAIEEAGKTQWKTAVFGLVDYEIDASNPPDFKPERPETLQLRLNKLKLLVENDAVRSFTSEVEVEVETFLDTKVKPPKTLVIFGRYESRVTETGERRDTYTFETRVTLLIPFDGDHFLREVEINRIGLVTEIEDGKKWGKLLIDGAIAFREIGAGLDILGIDRIEFFGLGVRFGIDGGFVLRVDFPSLRFDFEGFNRRNGKSKPRLPSFLAKLPIKLRGFRFGEFSLPKIGYFDMSAIEGIKLVPDFKMAFDFDVNLGSLGSLGKKLERFKLSLLAGWKPQRSGRPELAFGFRVDVGEGAGGIDLGIEGIIKLMAKRFRVAKARSADGRELILLAADKVRLKVFSVDIPSKDEDLTFYLFAPMGAGAPFAENLGWYARLVDNEPEPPVAVSELALGQRVYLRFDEVKTVRQTMAWLQEQQEFQTDEEFVRFAAAPGSVLSYAPNREWFVAMAGTFFEIVEIQLLLRDPDLYGVYFALLGEESLSVDLVYQKLADGVGRYAAEIMLPAELRNMDFGAVAVTLGAIRIEVYTDGGFLIDLGFPEDVDYSRSFVVQGGPFIGKGGFYIGRVAREAMPSIPAYPTGKAFRVGFALRIGLGREVKKGPMSASLSVSVYGRFEGLIARKHGTALESDAAPALLAGRGYYIWIQGEVGIILEIEGKVDLKLIQAKLLIRAWVGSGVTFESGQPIVLHARMGVHVSVEVVIGRIKIFGKKIKITVRVSYQTELRYEWVLPARTPETFLAPTVAPQKTLWQDVALSELTVPPVAFELKLLLDISRSIDGGARAVLVPSAFLFAPEDQDGAHPLRTLGAALVELGVRTLGKDPATVYLTRAPDEDHPDDLDAEVLREALAGLDQMPTADLVALLSQLFPGATVDIAFGDSEGTAPVAEAAEQTAEAFAFPIPPGLQLRIGTEVYDFSQLGMLTDGEVEAIVDDLARQFAQTPNPRSLAAVEADVSRPGVDHLFRSWCELFALTTLDTLQNEWDSKVNRIKLAELLAEWDWRTAAQRSGRTFNGGLRVADGTSSKALTDKVGLLLPLPTADADISIEGIAGSTWLSKQDSVLKLLAANAALVASADPKITCSVVVPPAIHSKRRSFLQPPWVRLRKFAGGQEAALFNRFSEDLQKQAHGIASNVMPPLEHKARKTNTVSGEEVDELALASGPPLALAFDMACDLVPRGRAEASGDAEAVEDCIQVSGSSEAERRPLDALLAGDETMVEQRLRGARAYLAFASATAAEDYEFIEAEQQGVKLARATTSVERRPGYEFAFRSVTAEDDIFIADGRDLPNFLRLLQRSAIVNSSGTYLLLPPNSPLFDRFATDPKLRLTVIVVFDAAAALPVRAVNGCCIANPADRRLMQQLDDGKPRRLVTRAVKDARVEQQASLFETVALREPGSAVLRVLRPKPQEARPSDPPTLEECEAHLAAQFDMLEYGVEGGGQSLLAMDRSVPVASEEAVPANATAAQRDDLLASLPDPAKADELLRYDLVVVLWRLRGLDNPYEAVDTQDYRIRLGWRDLYGNRLGKVVYEHGASCLYQDPLVPLHAWPGVRAWAAVGTRARTLTANFAFLPEPTGNADEQLDWTRRVRAVIHQLEGPGVTVRLVSSLGTVGNVGDLKAKLVAGLKSMIGSGRALKPLRIEAPITIDTMKAHSEIDLQLIVERETGKCDPLAPPDVRTTASSLSLRHRAAIGDAEPVDGASFKIATEFFAAFPGYRAALGTNDIGGSCWWAVDERLIPAPTSARPIMYSQPPLARAPMSESGVEFEQLEPNGSKTKATANATDVDSDVLMASLLEKVDDFLAPPLAPRTSRLPGSGGAEPPFVRVMKAKKAMLGVRPDILLRHVRPVYHTGTGGHESAARRALREALATQMSRFHEVASVVVQPLVFARDVPDSWFPVQGEEETAPKLYGRFRFGGTDDAGDAARNLIRVLNHGIPLRGRDTELAFSVLPPADTTGARTDIIDLTDKVLFEITHVERMVGTGELSPSSFGSFHPAPAPAPSRWLSFVPVDGAKPFPVVDVSRNAKVIVPAPLRRLPRPPAVTEPEILPGTDGQLPTPYAEAIHAAKQWRFQFKLGGIEVATDQACCRLVYNAGVGIESLPTVQSAAQPLFPGLLRALIAFNQAMVTAWPEIAAAAGPAVPTHFTTASELFADYLEKVVVTLTAERAAFMTPAVDEDRFILYWKSAGNAVVHFVDHVPSTNGGLPPGSEPTKEPRAGEGAPLVRLSYAGTSLEKGVSSPDYKAEFSLGGTIGGPFAIGIRPLDALELQSIWAAASVRRNAIIDNKPLDPLFVYRTPEIYMQEALVPRLKVEPAIDLGVRPAESLATRLEAALVPVFEGASGKIPVQLRVGLESIRFATATSPPSGGGFIGESDPKLQVVEEVGTGDVSRLAHRIAGMISAMVAAEPIGRLEDVRLVLSVTALSQGKQPLLDIVRILIPLDKVTVASRRRSRRRR